MDPLLKNLGPILTLLGVLGAAYFTYRASNRKLRSDSTFLLLNERQEEAAELRKENAALRRTQRLQADYIGQLRRHIADQEPPPPPPWPEGLVV